MEWSKAKTIMIILFVILNVFLFASILYSNSSLGLDSDYVKNVNNLLKSRNISLEADVPSYHSSSGKIDYQDAKIDKNRLVNFLFGHQVEPQSDPDTGKTVWKEDGKVLEIGNNIVSYTDDSPDKNLSVGDKSKLVNELGPYFEGLGLKKDDYAADTYREQDGFVYIRFLKKYEGQYLFDVYADFSINQAGVESMNAVLRDAMGTVVPDEILSAYQVLVIGAVPQNSIIKEIRFGYKQLNAGDLNDSPVWRIRYSDGRDEFYNAYNGAKLGVLPE